MANTIETLNALDTVDPALSYSNVPVPSYPVPVPSTAARSKVVKRSRISLACTSCRNRKSKCDGQRPRCLSCIQLHLPCEYQQPPQPSNRNPRCQSKVQLLAKVKELESRLNSTPADSPSRSSPGNVSASAPDGDDHPTTSPLISDLPAPDSTRPRTSATIDLHEETTVDVLATVAFNQESESNIGHFGPSSNHVLFRSTSDAFARIVSLASSNRPTLKATRSSERQRQEGSSQQSGRQTHPRDIDVTALPRDPEASAFIDHFFASVGAFLPFVSKSALVADYHRLRDEKAPPRLGARRALLNSVFALASASLGEEDSSVFNGRALASLNERQLRGTSVELVQALLLIATYQQNHQLSITSWTYHALAVKAAFQLGLHSPLGYKEYGLQESEMRKRLWYSLIHQDRVLGMCLGRPCLISPQYIRTQKPLDPQSVYRSMPVVAPNYVDSIIYHNRQTSLYEIVGSILHHLYNDNVESDEPTRIQDIIAQRLSLQWELDGWRQHADPSCQVISGSELDWGSPSFPSDNFRFRLVLSAHYYRAVMLINAPVIIHVLSETVHTQRPKQDSDLVSEHVVVIVRHDFKVVRELHQIIQTMSTYDERFLDQSNAWWLCNYTSQYPKDLETQTLAFLSADMYMYLVVLTVNMHFFGILLLCHLDNTLWSSAGISRAEVRQCLNQGITTMKSIQRTSLMARKARHCLVGFLEVFDSLVPEQETTPASLANQSATEDILSSAGPTVGLETNNFSQCVTQAANNFLWQYSQSNFLGDHLALFGEDIT
ncbi:uncharacterized protein Z518_06711 [Rhinocladiella mackenziei CBS 650.93]|uniref:Zn(2)-C6 fungal-type domain-containing protein n=1 Tax=Rhinocladiella mackenziei CBS 650.93 TaxID=1442369 RepID=A0A0D2J2J8_9EURO|nr:uncharacterized protein Z518_06711 [Rhinocladiella mackenziei CBS 650.93]KIX03160.1 hypothetical protein Z518_06711 [Rhinocladiella mackenziei CBS 650.93]